MTTPALADSSAVLADSPALLPGEHLERLRSRLSGRLVLPRDADWDAHRAAWQLLVDQHPAAVVLAADESDIVETVMLARRLGLHVAPQSTGHGAAGIPSLADTILVRTTAMDRVEIDPAGSRARIGAGATWGQVATAAAEHGLAAVAGMAPTVGVVGFSLGGGLGWLARSHGLAANSITAIDAVDAHGRTIRLDAEHYPALFWAARGGAAPVVVTAVELQLYPIGELWAGGMLWPIDHASDVVHAWREWIADVPDTVTSLARVLRYPPIPEVPDVLRGRSFVAIEAAIQGDAAEASQLLRPLRDLQPELDSIRRMSPAGLGMVHGDPPGPSAAYGEAVVLSEISAGSVDALVGAALAPSAESLLSIELRQLGGMLSPGRASGGAVSAVDGAGLVYGVGIVPVPDALAPVRSATTALVDALSPYASEHCAKNFRERPASPQALYGDAAERVRRVVAAWDPEGVIRTAHPLD